MQTLHNIELIPVIELYPADLGKPYSYPSTPHERYLHWKEVMDSFGISQLEPIEIGYNIVKTTDIDDNALEKLMLMAINGIETEEEEIEVVTSEEEEENLPTSFEGGVAMLCDGEIFVTPQCCVSLQDHQEWATVQEKKDFGMIWIGHPWLCYLHQGDNILLTGLIEKDFHKDEWRFYHANENNDLTTFQYSDTRDSNKITPSDFRYSISKTKFAKAVANLNNELTHFKSRIAVIAEKLGLENPKIIANYLVDGNGEILSYLPENNEVVFVDE